MQQVNHIIILCIILFIVFLFTRLTPLLFVCFWVLILLVALLFCLLWKGGLLEGWRGWAYAQQRMYAELLLHLMLLEGHRNLSTPP